MDLKDGGSVGAFAFGGSLVDLIFKTSDRARFEIESRLEVVRRGHLGDGETVKRIRRCWSADVAVFLAVVFALLDLLVR
ncbi:hypothetical protein H3146_13635 [Streptomyces sp. OF3]|uniref:Uncharacterized protein n=1 Tax=Streptomyces alkaliterrae TaxID=2213162 RepID=A0A7W3ZNA7_9ACTN|nr:hypothetical protein [Streptomyces alkaliterrae]MBB1254396.1 hypothetical protein [Streptomyces alkaliterrae]